GGRHRVQACCCDAPATPARYPLSLHDALPISWNRQRCRSPKTLLPRPRDCSAMAEFRMPSLGADMDAAKLTEWFVKPGDAVKRRDRKSTRLNSSHVKISYAVFCLQKKRRRQAA